MNNVKIKLVYKQVIDEFSESGFEKAVFKASYHEFLLKCQAYDMDGKLKTFTRMKENDGRANSLHYKLSFSVLHFIGQLNNKIPVVRDNAGNKITFETPRFELIESHSDHISQHKIAINYETADLTLIEVMGEYLLLAADNFDGDQQTETFVVRMQPNLSVINYRNAIMPPMMLMHSK
jgi:hypothetical protein